MSCAVGSPTDATRAFIAAYRFFSFGSMTRLIAASAISVAASQTVLPFGVGTRHAAISGTKPGSPPAVTVMSVVPAVISGSCVDWTVSVVAPEHAANVKLYVGWLALHTAG